MFVNQADSEHLNQIRQAVYKQTPIDKIIELCQAISQQVTDGEFPFAYAGILLASKNRISDSIRVLKLCPKHTFSVVLADYLEQTQAFSPAAKAFQETTPYDVWTQTDLYKSQMAGTVDAIAAFAQRTPPPSSTTCPTIIDIGPGNGVLLVEMIKRLLSFNLLEEIHLILIEKSPKMLVAAQKYCQKSLSIPIRFTLICCQIQKVTAQQLAILEKHQPIWFINASLSLHHLSREIKVPTLKMLANLSPYCLISDANYNHDLPEKDTPELIYSVTENYGFVIQDILKSSASETGKKLCIDNFLLTEAINILKNTREYRRDYHALIPEWQEIAEQGGWNVVKTTPTVSLPQRTLTFTMELQANILMKPLGKILEEAGLIHQNQLQVVLMEQNTYSHLKIGEILALHGWLKQETADFFAETIQQPVKKETFDLQIGEFFNQAGLLSKKDIENILSEQKKTGIKFGSIAVLKGFIKRQTLDFFLKNFTLKTNEKSDFQDRDKDTLTQKRLSLQTQNKSYLSIYYDLAIVYFTKASSVTNKLEKLEILKDFRNLYLKIEKLQTRNDPSMGKLPKQAQERLDKIYISVLAELAKFE